MIISTAVCISSQGTGRVAFITATEWVQDASAGAQQEELCRRTCQFWQISAQGVEKGLANKIRVEDARRVQRSFCLVKCGAATEPCELV